MTARLRMRSLQKSFGATRALRGVDLEVGPGEVHALIGENGAGKSTLMKILSGAHAPDSGTIELDGKPFRPANPMHARHSGVSMIYQELNLAPHLSVEENIMLGEEPTRLGWIDRSRRRARAAAALAELRHEGIPLDAPVSSRPVAEQQIVEIARALITQPKLLIMDEPTSSLTDVDTKNLFQVIHRLRERGVSVIYISHFLEECQEVCDRLTVLRDGESVGTGAMAETPVPQIIRMMVGREIADTYPRGEREMGEPLLEFRNLAGFAKPKSATLSLRKGEILGIAGLIGAGRTETLRACFGLDAIRSGEVWMESRECTRATPGQRLSDGIGLLSENRKEEGLMLNRSLADNLTVTRYDPVSRFGIVQAGAQREASQKLMDSLEVRAESPDQPVGELSGGNQQKIAIGRLLHHQAKVLLLDEPTRGIDVGSKVQIYRLMDQLAASGKGVLFVSSYLPELLGVCDTIGVMCRGTLSEVRPVADWTEHSIISAAIGQTE
ncbi:MAG: sugar ABC transporter ATP-binding protein [Verrucomicrobia bacterium]|jgi:ribose transport system ATP-binding protein|nr:sugar ABC transporter ATP-binding protein [Verrucomicrobiota bacterium]